MADTRKYLQTQKFTLKTSISLSDTSIELSSFNLPDGTAITASDIGTINYATIAPGTSNEEQISFTGFSGTTLSGVTRGLKFNADYSQDTDLRKAHAAGTVLVLSNTAAFYDNFVNKGNDETITGTLAVPEPTSASHVATKNYVDTNINGGTVSYDNISVAGNAGETVAAGELVYFDDTDNEWKLCDADTATTVDDVMIGIAQGAGTDGAAISGGVLIRGLDANQTGLTVGVKLYVGNTAGAISESAGTTERVIGWSKSATEVYFDPAHNTNPTADEKDAMVGSSGTPSSTNTFITEDDVATDGTTDKVVRATGTALPTLIGGVSRKLSLSSSVTEIANNTASETNIFSVSIPANYLGTNNAVRFKMPVTDLSFNSVSDTLTIRVKYGSTTLVSQVITDGAGTLDWMGNLEVILMGNGGTSAQRAVSQYWFSDQATNTSSASSIIHSIDTGTSTEDSTGALNFVVSIQWNDASASHDFVPAGYLIEYIS